jgi:hypothetical protein
MKIKCYAFKLVGMLSPELVLVIDEKGESKDRDDKIVQWNLRTYEILLVDCSEISGVRIFAETSLFCCYMNKSTQNKIKVAYYKYPLTPEKNLA